MSEEQKQEASIHPLQREYLQQCQRAGDLEYRKKCIDTDLAQAYSRMTELNKLFADEKAKEQENVEKPAEQQ